MQKLDSLPVSPNEAIDVLKKETESSIWELRLTELMKLAAKGDKNTWTLIYQVMREADAGRLSWGFHRILLSGFVYLLSYVGDSKSYRVLINYVKSLDRPIPIGAMELISDLLPTFGELDTKELFQISKMSDELKSAFGVLALTKLCFESRLTEVEKSDLKEFLLEYKNYKYYLTDTIDSTLEFISEAEEPSILGELDGILE